MSTETVTSATGAPIQGNSSSGARQPLPRFEVRLAKSGQTFTVEEGESVAHVLQLEGIHVDMVCEQGVCGTCMTRWTEGDPDHQDSCMSAEERKTHVALCCVRSFAPTLTLDL
jgi:ferredoxin